jgi:uncharacterized protein (DUF1499 family)
LKEQAMHDAPRERAGKRLSKFALSGLVLGAGGIAVLVASGIGYRIGWWQVGTALNIAEWAVYAAALGLVVSVIGAVLSRPGARQRGFVLSLLGIAASLPVVAIAVQWEYATRTYPPINDISTDTENPPVFWDMPNPTEYPGAETAMLQRAAYPDLAPLILSVAPERAYALAMALAKEKGWEIIADRPDEGRIEAVARSLLYGFKDEIIIRIATSDSGARVDLRSRSRIGRIDRGVNAKRIRAFLAALKENAGKVKQ